MKRLFLFLLFVFVPNISFALSDGCVDPKNYNFDRRCYVTDVEKTKFPYNTIVKINDNATGVIIGPNTILTCRSCVNPENNKTENISVEFYTSDGKVHFGTVDLMPDSSDFKSEWAIIDTPYTFSGPFMDISNNHIAQNMGSIGFSFLKVLNDEEADIAKSEYIKILKKYQGKTTKFERIQKSISELEGRLKKLQCKTPTDKSCVMCSDGEGCIFNDFNNMKKQFGCNIVVAQANYDETDCLAGDKGSPLIDGDGFSIKGIIFTNNIFFNYLFRESSSLRIESFYDEVQNYLRLREAFRLTIGM